MDNLPLFLFQLAGYIILVAYIMHMDIKTRRKNDLEKLAFRVSYLISLVLLLVFIAVQFQ